MGVLSSSEFQQAPSVVPELAEGNQGMQYFFQQNMHHVGIMAVRAVPAQPGEIGGFQLRSVPFIPDDASSAGSPRPAGIFPVPQIKKVAVFQHVELEGCAGTCRKGDEGVHVFYPFQRHVDGCFRKHGPVENGLRDGTAPPAEPQVEMAAEFQG